MILIIYRASIALFGTVFFRVFFGTVISVRNVPLYFILDLQKESQIDENPAEMLYLGMLPSLPQYMVSYFIQRKLEWSCMDSNKTKHL